MINPLMSDTVTLLRRTDVADRYGNVVPGEWTPTVVPGCALLPPQVQITATLEAIDNRDQVSTLRILFAPAGTDIRPTDRVQHGGVTYDVDGSPSAFPGSLAHVEVNLKAVTG